MRFATVFPIRCCRAHAFGNLEDGLANIGQRGTIMVRDPGLETIMRRDLGALPGLRETPMFGGLCFLLNDHMLCAARKDRGMYRVGRQNEPAALALRDTSPMVHGGRGKPGYVWAHALAMADRDTRTQLTAMALQNAAGLPRKG